MDIGKLAELIVTDCKMSLTVASQEFNQPIAGEAVLHYKYYLAYLRGEKSAEGMLPVINETVQMPHKLLKAVFGEVSSVVLPTDEEAVRALEQAKPELEILFTQYGAR